MKRHKRGCEDCGGAVIVAITGCVCRFTSSARLELPPRSMDGVSVSMWCAQRLYVGTDAEYRGVSGVGGGYLAPKRGICW